MDTDWKSGLPHLACQLGQPCFFNSINCLLPDFICTDSLPEFCMQVGHWVNCQVCLGMSVPRFINQCLGAASGSVFSPAYYVSYAIQCFSCMYFFYEFLFMSFVHVIRCTEMVHWTQTWSDCVMLFWGELGWGKGHKEHQGRKDWLRKICPVHRDISWNQHPPPHFSRNLLSTFRLTTGPAVLCFVILEVYETVKLVLN